MDTASERDRPVGRLRALVAELEQHQQRQPGDQVLIDSHQAEWFNAALAEADAALGTDLRATRGFRGSVIEANKKRGRPIDGVSRDGLLSHARRVLVDLES